MKCINSSGTLCVTSGDGAKFVNFMAAYIAMNAVQLFYAVKGFSTHTDIYKEVKRVEVRVHFNSFLVPALPCGYIYSSREITSTPYISSYAKPGERVRVITYYFKF